MVVTWHGKKKSVTEQTIEAKSRTNHVALPTGTLVLTIDLGPEISELCDFAARANPKRGFLFVSKVLGRHVPARPVHIRAAMDAIAATLSADLPQPVVFLGMAETATALGQGVYAAFQARNPSESSAYLQTSRQQVRGTDPIAKFEEGHSHATSHLVQIADPAIIRKVKDARTLVVIDDECSTGNTFVSAVRSMLGVMKELRQIETCCITDWSGGDYLADMPYPARRHSILSGWMEWHASNPVQQSHQLAESSNGAGIAPPTGMRSRCGLHAPEAADRVRVHCQPGERILVLGDGEHSYEALRIAEEIEAQGGIAAVQSITRTPAMVGHAMRSRSTFTDVYGSGAPTFLYNILAHDPDRVIIAAELVGNQAAEAASAMQELGRNVPVQVVLCQYRDEE